MPGVVRCQGPAPASICRCHLHPRATCLPADVSLLPHDPLALHAYPPAPPCPPPRLAEHEADVIGLRLMARACFDPSSAPLMLAKLNSKEKEMEQVGGNRRAAK